MTSGPLRIVRAGTAAALALALGVAGHAAIARPDLGSPVVSLAAVCVVALMTWCVARRERGLASIAGVLLAGQALTHVALAASSLAGASHSADGGLTGNVAYCVLNPSALAGTEGGAGPIALMIGLHALATVACALWLRRGERWLVSRLRVVVRAVGRALSLPTPIVRITGVLRLVAPAGEVEALRALAAPCRGCSRRGPPAALPVLA